MGGARLAHTYMRYSDNLPNPRGAVHPSGATTGPVGETILFCWVRHQPRAKEHMEALRDEAITYIHTRPHHFTNELQDEGDLNRELVTKVYFKREPPKTLSLLIGEILYNLRFSSSEFPIFDCRTRYLGRDIKGQPQRGSGRWRIRAIDPKAQAVIEGLQPYHRGDNRHADPLWKLHRLCNIDKHRVLHVLGGPIGAGSIVTPGVTLRSTETFLARPIKDGAVVARTKITLPTADTKVQVQHYIPGDIAFNDPDLPVDNYVMRTLNDILGRIEGDVMPSLGSFLPS